MAEYIERKKLKEAFDNADPDVYESYPDGYGDWGFGRENVRDVIRGVPTADVAPVVHGRWDDSGRYVFPSGSTAGRCTNCGCALTESEYRMNNWNYCPNCGAKMDGGDGDAAD